jgi:hypothetical protein
VIGARERFDPQDVACDCEADQLRSDELRAQVGMVGTHRSQELDRPLPREQHAEHPSRLRVGDGGAEHAEEARQDVRVVPQTEREPDEPFTDVIGVVDRE